MPAIQFYNFCFTINNPTKSPLPNASAGVNRENELYKNISYMIWGDEVGESGTRHFQGYCELKVKKTLTWIQKYFEHGIHVEKRMGSQQQAIDYCKKDGKFEEFGKPKDSGERTDLKSAAQAIIEKKATVEDLVLENPILYHQYGRTLEKLEDVGFKGKPRTEMTKIIWFWGPTGTGKSKEARERAGNSAYWHNFSENWWEYQQEEYIIFDDFRGEMKYNNLLKLADRYPYTVPIKGGKKRNINAKWIIITCPMHPSDVYCRQANKKDAINQLMRRIHEIKEFMPAEEEDPYSVRIDEPEIKCSD